MCYNYVMRTAFIASAIFLVTQVMSLEIWGSRCVREGCGYIIGFPLPSVFWIAGPMNLSPAAFLANIASSFLLARVLQAVSSNFLGKDQPKAKP